jgi:hypothetical protein
VVVLRDYCGMWSGLVVADGATLRVLLLDP